MKTYYQKNKKRILEYQNRYYQKNKKEILEYYQKHKKDKADYQRKKKKEKQYKRMGYFLTRRLTELNKTQSWLAKQAETSRENISSYSAGVYYPRIERRRKICRALKIKLCDLENIANQNS